MYMRNASGVIMIAVILWVFIAISGFTKTEKGPDFAKDLPPLPGMHEDRRIGEPPEYKLTARQDPVQSRSVTPNNSPAGSAHNSTAGGTAAHGRYTMKRLPENNLGFSF